jgi:hypothetical protein
VDGPTKANLILGVGDLYQKHANLVEPYVKRLYRQLHPPAELVVR